LISLAKQKGNVLAFLLPLLVVGLAFAYLFSLISSHIPTGGPVPFVLVSFFLFPIASIWPLLKDVTEVQEGVITKSEAGRLSVMINSIQNYLKASALMLVLFGILSGVMLYLVQVSAIDAKLALSCIGFFLGAVIFVALFIINTRIKLQNYKTKLARRVSDLKQKKKLIKSLQTEKSDKSTD
jgi:hypothetical protein